MTKLVATQSFRLKTQPISQIAWSPDGERLALLSSEESSLTLLQSRGGYEVSHRVYGMCLHALAWSPDSTFLALAGEEAPGNAQSTVIRESGRVALMDALTQQVRQVLMLPRTISSLAWSPDNLYMAIATTDVRIQEVAHQKLIVTIPALEGRVAHYVAWLPNSRHVLVAWSTNRGEIERTLTIHEALTGKHVRSIQIDQQWEKGSERRAALALCSFAVAPGGAILAVSAACSAAEGDPEAPVLGIISLIDLASGLERQIAAGIFGRVRHGPFIESLSWSYDARFLTATAWFPESEKVFVIEVVSGKGVTVEVELHEQKEKAVRMLAWSPAEARFALVTRSLCLIYDLQTSGLVV